MSSSNCCFLTYIQISQEAGQVVWYSHLFKNFPQFVVIHTVKGFSTVNEAEVDIFLKFPCFFYDPLDVGASLVAQLVKNLPAMWETWVQSLGWEDPLEKGMVIHSSILAWTIPMDRGAWRATVHGFANSQTQLGD